MCKIGIFVSLLSSRVCWWNHLGLEYGGGVILSLTKCPYLLGGLGMDRKRENRAIHILFNLCWLIFSNYFLKLFPLYQKFKMYQHKIVCNNLLLSFTYLLLNNNIPFLFYFYLCLLFFCISFIFFILKNISSFYSIDPLYIMFFISFFTI